LDDTTLRSFDSPTDGTRLDTLLGATFDDISRTYARHLIDEGRVTLRGKPAKPSDRPAKGDRIVVSLPPPRPMGAVAQEIPLSILYEDEYLLVVDKPKGMVVHPAAGHADGTLVNALLAHCGDHLSDLNGVVRPGIVHRIDKDTSGLLLVVKDNRIHEQVAEKIRRHDFHRVYDAVVLGVVPEDSGTISAPIGRDPKDRKRMAVVRDGKPARTFFRTVERLEGATRIEATLDTGRTHQIRVHMAYIGHPVLGDPLYGGLRKDLPLHGQALHARKLGFDHPVDGRFLEFESEPPAEFLALVERLRR
jgi:23S rRNA pseudouridine1911/1915/1917 synthase